MTETAPIRSLLIVRLSAIGDVIHTLPALAVLRAALPETRIGWLVEEVSAPLLQHHPHLDALHVIPRKRWRQNHGAVMWREILPFLRKLRADKWDVAIDFQGLTKSGFFARASGAGTRIGFAGENSREMNRYFINRRVPVVAEETGHVVTENLQLLRALGIEAPRSANGTIGLLDSEKDTWLQYLRNQGIAEGEGVVALNPGAGWITKRWEPKRFGDVGAALALEHGLRPLILWGPGEESARDAMAEAVRARGVVPIVTPNTSLRDLAALLTHSRLYIGGDTGPTHLAAMLGVPVVGIYGASPSQRNRPWPPESGPVIYRAELECRPCNDVVCRFNDEREIACLTGISSERVLDAARALLATRSIESVQAT